MFLIRVLRYDFDNNMNGFYIAPAFMDKLVVHITKNFMSLPNIKARDHTQLNQLHLFILVNHIDGVNLCFFYFRFLLFLVFGEAKVRENLSNVSLCLPRWESRESRVLKTLF